MNIKIERGINNDGKNFCELFINGENTSIFRFSQLMTNTNSEGNKGIWENKDVFIKGEQRKEFNFGVDLVLSKMPLDYLKEELIKRSKVVREWVKSLPYKEEIEFTVSE